MSDYHFRVEADLSAPLVAAAIHDGHRLRPEIAGLLALSPSQRLREEDPFTAEWTRVAPNRVVVGTSRFEVDLNRPREEAVYRTPREAWGLELWKEPPPEPLVSRSLALYDSFYRGMAGLLDGLAERFGNFVVYDLHSYNHRRAGPQAPP
ncbi:MAG: N-formylglutamate amidohydrolase, partial [Longimicrobiaceae bacterium]